MYIKYTPFAFVQQSMEVVLPTKEPMKVNAGVIVDKYAKSIVQTSVSLTTMMILEEKHSKVKR